MSIVTQSAVSPTNHPAKTRTANPQTSNRRSIQPERHLLVVPAKPQVSELIPSSQLTGGWQRTLLWAQRGSLVASASLIALMLGVYAWTVYIQQMWSKEYRQLENLQRQERQMTAANESLKNQLAKTAENPSSGLVPPSLTNNIFLPSAPQRQLAPKSPAIAPPMPIAKKPLGY